MTFFPLQYLNYYARALHYPTLDPKSLEKYLAHFIALRMYTISDIVKKMTSTTTYRARK
jgi:hypothetical protein